MLQADDALTRDHEQKPPTLTLKMPAGARWENFPLGEFTFVSPMGSLKYR